MLVNPFTQQIVWNHPGHADQSDHNPHKGTSRLTKDDYLTPSERIADMVRESIGTEPEVWEGSGVSDIPEDIPYDADIEVYDPESGKLLRVVVDEAGDRPKAEIIFSDPFLGTGGQNPEMQRESLAFSRKLKNLIGKLDAYGAKVVADPTDFQRAKKYVKAMKRMGIDPKSHDITGKYTLGQVEQSFRDARIDSGNATADDLLATFVNDLDADRRYKDNLATPRSERQRSLGDRMADYLIDEIDRMDYLQ